VRLAPRTLGRSASSRLRSAQSERRRRFSGRTFLLCHGPLMMADYDRVSRLHALADRVEIEESSDELWHDIALALGWKRYVDGWHRHPNKVDAAQPPNWLISLDACAALMPEGWFVEWCASFPARTARESTWEVELWQSPLSAEKAAAPTLARAGTAAILRGGGDAAVVVETEREYQEHSNL
jgi:hypothetical protein